MSTSPAMHALEVFEDAPPIIFVHVTEEDIQPSWLLHYYMNKFGIQSQVVAIDEAEEMRAQCAVYVSDAAHAVEKGSGGHGLSIVAQRYDKEEEEEEAGLEPRMPVAGHFSSRAGPLRGTAYAILAFLRLQNISWAQATAEAVDEGANTHEKMLDGIGVGSHILCLDLEDLQWREALVFGSFESGRDCYHRTLTVAFADALDDPFHVSVMHRVLAQGASGVDKRRLKQMVDQWQNSASAAAPFESEASARGLASNGKEGVKAKAKAKSKVKARAKSNAKIAPSEY
eukprot:g1700.t1